MLRTFRLFAIGLLAVLGVAIAAIGCGGGGPLTVEEYARAVCPLAPEYPQEPTWGDVARSLEDFRGRIDVSPPAALKAYHETTLEAIDAMVELAGEQPARERIGLEGSFDLLSTAGPAEERLERVVENMAPELRAVLAENGCG